MEIKSLYLILKINTFVESLLKLDGFITMIKNRNSTILSGSLSPTQSTITASNPGSS